MSGQAETNDIAGKQWPTEKTERDYGLQWAKHQNDFIVAQLDIHSLSLSAIFASKKNSDFLSRFNDRRSQ